MNKYTKEAFSKQKKIEKIEDGGIQISDMEIILTYKLNEVIDRINELDKIIKE